MKKVYVITGGTGGMGVEIAKYLGKKGTIILADVNEERLQATTELLKELQITDVLTRKLDITNQDAVKALAKETSELGIFAGIAHTAGLSPTMADSRKIMEVNLVGTGYILDAFLPYATENTAVVCIASSSAYFTPQGPYDEMLMNPLAPNVVEEMEQYSKGNSGYSYGLSKLGVKLIVEDQAWNWGQKGARIVSVTPGTINTAMGRQEAAGHDSMKVMLDNTPLRREGEPSEIASVVNFLMSEEASYITGSDIKVDGGTIAQMNKLRKTQA